MRTSETIDKFAAAMAAAQAEMKNAAFDKENPHFKSRYATLAAVRDTVAPVLSKHGLSVVQTTDFDGGAWLVQTRIIHTSGQWIESVYPFAIDKPQQMGSALTYARRYSLSMICGIASEEDDDGNEAQKGEQRPATPANDRKKYDHSPLVRKAYEELDRVLNQIGQSGTMEDLKVWWGDKATQTKLSDLPADYRTALTEKKDEIKSTLTEKAA